MSVRSHPRVVAAAIVFLALVGSGVASAQPTYARDGWEAFPMVEYQGGDSTQPKKRRRGILVLTESTLALHRCSQNTCKDRKPPELPFKEPAILSIPLVSVKSVSRASDLRAVSGADRKEVFVIVVYETETTAEAPVFKTLFTTHAPAIEAKLRFRLDKLGVKLRSP